MGELIAAIRILWRDKRGLIENLIALGFALILAASLLVILFYISGE